MIEHCAICRSSTFPLALVACGEATAVWAHEQCERFLSTTPVRRRSLVHPVFGSKPLGAIGIGYVRCSHPAAMTDSLGWMRITEPTTST
jgi:hypothetical protein